MSNFTTNNYVVGPTAPAPAMVGDVWMNSTNQTTLVFNGVTWVGNAYEILTDLQNQVAAASYAVSHTIYVQPNTQETYRLSAVTATFGTTSTSGTLQVEVATGTQAIAAGVNQLTGTMSLSGTANTPVNGTVLAAPATIAAGNRINLIFGGTVTNLANAAITVALQKLS